MRPIDADALLDALYDNEFQTLCPLDEVSSVIDTAHTLDYAPVRHGEWVEEGSLIWCSRCLNSPLYDYFGKIKLSSSCPHCGAKMDGGKEDG